MIRLLSASALLFLVLTGTSSAGEKVPKEDNRNVITAIDLKNNTMEITHMSHGIKTSYFLAPGVIVHINDKDATIKDLKVGMATKGLTIGTETEDPATLDEVDIGNTK